MKFEIPAHTKEFIYNYLRSKRFKIAAFGFAALAILAVIFKLLFFRDTTFEGFSEIVLSPYLSLIAHFAAWILQLIHYPVNTEDFKVITSSGYTYQLTSGYLSKTWVLITFSFIAFVPSGRKKTIIFSVLAVITHLLFSIIQIVIASLLISGTMTHIDAKNVGYTFVVGAFCILIAYWLKTNNINADRFFPGKSVKGISKSRQILLFFLGAVILKNLIISLFKFSWLNSFLLGSTQHIVSYLGYDSMIEGQTLFGSNGNLYLAKYCFGLEAMYIFSAFVWLTGDKALRKSIFIISGIVFINLTNIVRLALLFMHIQKYGDYKLSMDLHELFNITIYSLIFLMWVLWIEKFSDLWKAAKFAKSSKNIPGTSR